MPKPDNADQVIQDYLTGCIGMKELKKELNLKPGLKTTDLWYFKDFLKDHHIAKYINFHDILVSPHSIKNSMQQDFVTLAVITYENGEEDVFFGEPNVLFRKGELNHEWHEP